MMQPDYQLLGVDEGKQNLLMAHTGNSEITWKKSLSDYPTARAMQALDDGTVLIGYDRGYFVVDARNGDVLHTCGRWKNITSVSRLPDGTTLLTGLNLEGREGVCVLSLDRDDGLVHTAVRPGDYVRLMTPVGSDTYLLSVNDHICETDRELKTVRSMKAEGFLHAWQSYRYEDGRTLVSAGYGGFLALFSKEGNLLKTFGGKGDVPEEVNPHFYASLRLAEDGNILVANWQGHGQDNGRKGKQLVCFSPEGEYLTGWSFPEDVSSLQGLLLLSS